MPGDTCPICAGPLQPDEAVKACPRCGDVSHERCWDGAGGCVQSLCRATESLVGGQAAEPARATEESDGDGVQLERFTAALTRTAVPQRVKTGEFSPQGMMVETASGRAVLPWNQVQFICTGFIEEALSDGEPTRSGLRSAVRKLFFGESNEERIQHARVRQTLLADVYCEGHPAAWRIDAGSVNYRAFLGEVSYISTRNFCRLVRRVVADSTSCRVDASTVALLAGRRDRMRRYASVYDFELESAQRRGRLSDQVLGAEAVASAGECPPSLDADVTADGEIRLGIGSDLQGDTP